MLTRLALAVCFLFTLAPAFAAAPPTVPGLLDAERRTSYDGSGLPHSGPPPLANMASIASGTLLGNSSGGSASPSALSAIPNGFTATTQSNTDTTTSVADNAFAQNILTNATGNVAAAVGDGATNNNTVLQAALTAGASGGWVRLPCGVFKITTGMVVTIANNQHLDFSGSGVDCTFIYVSGAVNALTISFGGIYASASVHDLTFETDQAGTTSAVVLSQAGSNINPALSALSRVENVNFLGYPNRATTVDYFAKGIDIENVSNVSISNIFFVGLATGPSTYGGIAIYLNGLPGSSTYGVVYNLSNVQTESAQDLLYINDYVQGVFGYSLNATNGYRGVEMNPSPSGLMDQIVITASQFGSNQSNDIVLGASAPHLIHTTVIGNYFLEGHTGIGAAGGVFISGKYTNIIGNDFLETVTTTSPNITTTGFNAVVQGNNMKGSTASDTAISIGSEANISGNIIQGFTTGITVPTGAGPATIASNAMNTNTMDYSVNSGASSVVITDTNPRLIANLPACNSAIEGSMFNIVNAAATPVYNAVLAGTASTQVNAVCDGTNYRNH